VLAHNTATMDLLEDRTVALCLLGNIAYLHGEKLDGKSLKWEFVDNEAANQWREGYQLPKV
jgi:hypothetical protein